jgi:hypothetical protein
MTPSSIMTVTFFDDYAAQTKREERVSLGELAHRIRTTTAPGKGSLPWLKLARFGDAKTLAGSLRSDGNVIACTGVEADYDGEKITLDTAIEVAEKAGLGCIIYTSPSHTEERPRWRILCPIARASPPQDRARLLGRLNGLYRGIFARESWTLSQAYYYGSGNSSPAHRVELVDGLPLDGLDELDAVWLGPPGSDAAARIYEGASAEAREDAELIRRIVTAEGFHTELCALAARYVGRGMATDDVGNLLRGLMLSHPENARDARWHDRCRSIGGIVVSANSKFAAAAAARRAIARVTHDLARRRRPADEIRSAVIAEAERRNLSSERALKIASDILAEIVEGQRHG